MAFSVEDVQPIQEKESRVLEQTKISKDVKDVRLFHLCCKGKGIHHCFECDDFPCKRFRDFSKRWLKYGQDFIANQNLLKEIGADKFLNHFNSKIKTNADKENA